MTPESRRVCLVLIKPSHYDDEGYVIQWMRSAIPSNSLAVLYGLALECARQQTLGADVELEIHAIDETNKEAAEQDYGIPEDAARLEEGKGSDLLRLYPGLSQRHARINRARHPGDSKRVAR
jgi:hypothetical protein